MANKANDFRAKIHRFFKTSRTNKVIAASTMLVVLIVGYVVFRTGAAGFFAFNEPELGTLSGNAQLINDATASSGKAIQFLAASTPPPPTSSGDCTGGASRSCYPERFSVGAPGVGHYAQGDASLPVPAGYTEVFPNNSSSKEYDMYSCSGTTNIDHKYFHAFIYIGTGCHGTINITNSIIAPPPGSVNRSILVNSTGNLTLNISDTTIRPEPVPLGGKNDTLTDHAVNGCGTTCVINMNRVDVANSGGMCLCGENLTLEHSWLHDNFVAHLAVPSDAHTGGIFPYGGSGPLTIRFNRLEPGINATTGQETPRVWEAITAVLFTQSSGGSVLRNYNVHHNLLSGGAFDFYPTDGQDMIFKDNVLGPAHYGVIGSCSSHCPLSFADWSGNVLGDVAGNPTGVAVPKPNFP